MSNFGEIKTKLLSKLTESYNSDKKSEMTELLKKLKSNKELVKMYIFYESIEDAIITDKDKAKLIAEQLETQLIEKSKPIKKICKEFNKLLKDVVVEKNELYECLDTLSEETNLNNIIKKIDAKEKLVDILTMSKEKIEYTREPFTENHNLLNAVLTHDFNTKFNDFLEEEEKETFIKIVSMKEEDLVNEIKVLKESIIEKVDLMLNEAKNADEIEKLSITKNSILNSKPSKLEYYKLSKLKKDLI